MGATTVTQPKANVPVGRVVINGTTYDVMQHPEFVRFFFDLFRRVGGASGASNDELLDLAFFDAPSNPDAKEALRGLDELRNEIASLRSNCDGLLQALAAIETELQTLRAMDSLRNRVEQLEDRLA